MTGLPAGWALARLDKVTTPRGEKADPSSLGDMPFLGMDHIEAETSNLLGSQPVSELKSAVALFHKGDILYGRLRPYLNKVHIAEFDGAASAEFIVFPRMPAIEQRFLQSILRSPDYRSIADQRSTGDRPRIKFESVGDYEIPLPPLAEQRRIVRKLDTLTARTLTARSHLAAIEKLVERYRKAVTAGLFEELLAEHGATELGELCERITKGASPSWQGFEYAEDGIVFVRSQNVLWGALDLTNKVFLPTAFNEKQRNSVMSENDVLLNIVGASIGRSAVAPAALAGANCNQAVAVIRLKVPTSSDARYLSQWLTSPAAQAQITENAVDVARANFSLGQAKQLTLPWPPEEIRLQTLAKIENAFAKIDRLTAEAAKALKLLGHLDQRILAKAFAGDLVPQDPTDEPASALLERIREARANVPKKSRQRRTEVYAMKENPKDRLLADSASWPENGLPSDEVAKRVMMPHDDLRDALFELLGGPKPQLVQVFDKTEERMRLKRVAQ